MNFYTAFTTIVGFVNVSGRAWNMNNSQQIKPMPCNLKTVDRTSDDLELVSTDDVFKKSIPDEATSMRNDSSETSR